ncbi:diguanylate cyclase domain-containing protein [Pseudochelatococcus sp. G4_1912]|uniref:sensor domain-containing diguanylate cyclase n=1 Tax=Pseudochelatococcus sp. G4_1912 TaxID=3114288 RepID=UPI0039C69335
MTDELLTRLSNTITSARTTEEYSRPLLELLEFVTGLESTYLTRIDLEAGVQNILFARNIRTMCIPEGLTVPWNDTLCKRALDEGQAFTDDVTSCWGDSEAAKALGIVTYASAPVRLDNGSVYGTLCAASSERKPITPRSKQLLKLFAALIAQQIQREQLMSQLQHANAALEGYSNTDMLTGLPNRRCIFSEMHRLFALAKRNEQSILVAYIDLDDFKQINDTYGHDIGDAFLIDISQRLSMGLRAGDMLGRLGGDEFVVVAMGPSLKEDADHAVKMLRDRLMPLIQGTFHFGAHHFDYPGASCGAININPATISPQNAIYLADTAMYRDKKARKENVL